MHKLTASPLACCCKYSPETEHNQISMDARGKCALFLTPRHTARGTGPRIPNLSTTRKEMTQVTHRQRFFRNMDIMII
jgi:hypothetical protein